MPTAATCTSPARRHIWKQNNLSVSYTHLIQTGIMAQKQAEKVGQNVRVLCDGIDEESGLYL